MNGANIVAIVILAAIVIAVFAYLLHWLYRRSSKDVSFVRTGFGGEKVVMGGGAFVLPIIHGLTEVNMNTLRQEVVLAQEKSLITRDRLRVDLGVEFLVRVMPSNEGVATAARTLGSRTMSSENLRDLVHGRFVDAMGVVAASKTLEELHENRNDVAASIRKAVEKNMATNGLEVDSVAVTLVDQTGRDWFNPDNAFDAEGLTKLTEEIESRKKLRNEIEQSTMVSIRKKDLEAELESLNIQRESEFARISQEAEVSLRRSAQRAEIAQASAVHEREIEEKRLSEREATEKARIELEKELDMLNTRRLMSQAIEEQEKDITIAQKARERADSLAAAEAAKSKLAESEEKTRTVRELEIANRRMAIEVIDSKQQAEAEATRIRILAEAEKSAAADKAEADRIAVAAMKERYAVEAEGKRALNEAENMRTAESRRSEIDNRLVENLPAIIRESVKPMEKIDEIKILQVDGLGGISGNGDGVEKSGNPAEQVVTSALRYRIQAPFVDRLLGEIGLSASQARGVDPLEDLSKVMYSERDRDRRRSGSSTKSD